MAVLNVAKSKELDETFPICKDYFSKTSLSKCWRRYISRVREILCNIFLSHFLKIILFVYSSVCVCDVLRSVGSRSDQEMSSTGETCYAFCLPGADLFTLQIVTHSDALPYVSSFSLSV